MSVFTNFLFFLQYLSIFLSILYLFRLLLVCLFWLDLSFYIPAEYRNIFLYFFSDSLSQSLKGQIISCDLTNRKKRSHAVNICKLAKETVTSAHCGSRKMFLLPFYES